MCLSVSLSLSLSLSHLCLPLIIAVRTLHSGFHREWNHNVSRSLRRSDGRHGCALQSHVRPVFSQKHWTWVCKQSFKPHPIHLMCECAHHPSHQLTPKNSTHLTMAEGHVLASPHRSFALQNFPICTADHAKTVGLTTHFLVSAGSCGFCHVVHCFQTVHLFASKLMNKRSASHTRVCVSVVSKSKPLYGACASRTQRKHRGKRTGAKEMFFTCRSLCSSKQKSISRKYHTA